MEGAPSWPRKPPPDEPLALAGGAVEPLVGEPAEPLVVDATEPLVGVAEPHPAAPRAIDATRGTTKCRARTGQPFGEDDWENITDRPAVGLRAGTTDGNLRGIAVARHREGPTSICRSRNGPSTKPPGSTFLERMRQASNSPASSPKLGAGTVWSSRRPRGGTYPLHAPTVKPRRAARTHRLDSPTLAGGDRGFGTAPATVAPAPAVSVPVASHIGCKGRLAQAPGGDARRRV